MDPIVQRLIVMRFRSIVSEVVDFDNPTFFVGRNGAGKSNLADAFAFLAEAMSAPLSSVFDRRGGIAVVLRFTSAGVRPATREWGRLRRRFEGRVGSGEWRRDAMGWMVR